MNRAPTAKRGMPHRGMLIAALFGAALAGCETVDDLNPLASEPEPGSPEAVEAATLAAAPTTCPEVLVLAEAETVTLFAGGVNSTRPRDVIARGRIGNFSGRCEYTTSSVQMDLDLQIIAERGPALAADVVSLPYFITVLNPEEQVIGREVFDLQVALEGQNFGVRGEELAQTITLPRGPQSGPFYQVIVGFQLSDAQLQFNRSDAGF